MGFILNIIASLIAGALLLGIISIVSKWARWVLTGVLGRILNIDVECVFSNKTDAMADLQREIKRAKTVRILASRGNELQREPFASIFHERPKERKVQVEILLPRTTLLEGEYDWTAQRDCELSEFDPAFGNSLLHKQIEINADFLAPYIASKAAELYRYNSPHIGRIILTDRFAYYTPYHSDWHGSDSRVLKYRRGGDTYGNLERLLKQLREADPTADEKAERQSSHDATRIE